MSLRATREVEFAVAFGSRITGDARPASDLDIAVKFVDNLSARERFRQLCHLSGHLPHGELMEKRRLSEERFRSDVTERRAVERMFENAIQACVDLTKHVATWVDLYAEQAQYHAVHGVDTRRHPRATVHRSNGCLEFPIVNFN